METSGGVKNIGDLIEMFEAGVNLAFASEEGQLGMKDYVLV